jgi:hypothetical protein
MICHNAHFQTNKCAVYVFTMQSDVSEDATHVSVAILTSGLDVELLAHLLELWECGDIGDSDVDGGAQRGAQVGGTEGQVAVAGQLGELQLLFHRLDGLSQPQQKDLDSQSSINTHIKRLVSKLPYSARLPYSL